jgi:hypothetical protein
MNASRAQDERAARAARLAARPSKSASTADVETEAQAPAQRAAAAVRVKPVRLSLDLPPQNYRALKATCADLADELGAARVTTSEVLRALVTMVNQDPDVRRDVLAAIQSER